MAELGPAARLAERGGRSQDGRTQKLREKKDPDDTGALKLLRSVDRSVAGSHRCAVATETIIDAQREHVHVLTDPVVEYGYKARIGHREGVV